MNVTETIDQIKRDYEEIRDNTKITEFEIPGKFSELFELIQTLRGELSEYMTELMQDLLEKQLEKDFALAKKESDILANEPIPESPLPEVRVYDESKVVGTFLEDAKKLEGYKKESNLPGLFEKTASLLPAERSVKLPPRAEFIRMFIEVSSTMRERSEESLQLLRYMDSKGMTDPDSMTLIRALKTYTSQTSSKVSMTAMGEHLSSQ